MGRRVFLVVVVAASLAAIETESRGQLIGASGLSGGTFGSRSLSGNSSIGGTRSFGGTGGGSMGAMGMGMPSTGMGMGSRGGGLTVSRDQLLTRRNVQSFVGGDSQSMQAPVGVAQAGGNTGNRGGQGPRASAAGGRNPNQGGGNASRTNTGIRTRLNLGFSHPRVTTPQISTPLTRRMENLLGRRVVSGLEIAVAGGTATLRGVVATDHDRALTERLVCLEPGIWQVHNELLVAQPRPLEPPSTAGNSSAEERPAATPPELELPPEPVLPPSPDGQ